MPIYTESENIENHLFLDTHTAYIREPIITHNSSTDADWLKEVSFKQVFSIFSISGGHFSQKPTIFSLPVGKSHAKIKCRITSNPFELGQKLPLTTNRKSWSLCQNLSWKFAKNASSGEITMTSHLVSNKTSLSRKPCVVTKKLF